MTSEAAEASAQAGSSANRVDGWSHYYQYFNKLDADMEVPRTRLGLFSVGLAARLARFSGRLRRSTYPTSRAAHPRARRDSPDPRWEHDAARSRGGH